MDSIGTFVFIYLLRNFALLTKENLKKECKRVSFHVMSVMDRSSYDYVTQKYRCYGTYGNSFSSFL